MRRKRKVEEEFFASLLLEYFRAEIDRDAFEIPEVVDKPDLAIFSFGKVIGVELSQLPSSYIIKNLHKKRPAPRNTRNTIEGHLSVYPFEPHKWVHEVVDKKSKKVDAHKKRINADEMWLVMHPRSTKQDWPMSRAVERRVREAEALLMQFGTKGHESGFKRIIYTYTDGKVVGLAAGSGITPSVVSLPAGVGYPAVTSHKFSFSYDVPLPGLGVREYHFDEITFDETIVTPMDEWMAERKPEIERPKITCSARVDSKNIEWKVFRNGVLIADRIDPTSDHVGKTMYMHFLLEWSIQPTTLTYKA